MAIILNDENFEKEVNSQEKLVLVDFFADWCEPCSMLAPILEKVEKDFAGKIFLMKANLDSVPLVAQKFGVEKIPTVVLFKAGKPVSGFVGLASEVSIKEWLENMLKENSDGKENDEEKINEFIKKSREYAEENGFKLNPDESAVQRVAKGIMANEKKYGKKYCPCRRVSGNEVEDAKKICPCFWHKDEIAKDGKCFCALFVK